MDETFNLEDFELKGMVFKKALVSHNLSIQEANTAMKFCEWLYYMKSKSPSQYNVWIKKITKRLKEQYTEEECRQFIQEYIETAILPDTGKVSICCISDNFTDIILYRNMISLFYHNIVSPALDKNKKGIQNATT